MKKIIAIIMSALIAIAGICPAIAAGEPNILIISSSSASGEIGDEVEVTLTIENNPGYAALLLNIPEAQGFELVSAKSGSGMGTFTQGVNLLWDSSYNITKTGTLLTLTYRITDDAKVGNNVIKVNLLECNNEDRNAVVVVTEDINITVVESVETETVVTEPIETETVGTEPVVTEPIETETVGTEPVVTEPIETETVGTEPVVTEPIETETVGTEPIETETVGTEPVVSEPIETASATNTPEASPEEETKPIPADVLVITSSKVKAKRGERVTVTLSIENNPGYAVLIMSALEKAGFTLESANSNDDMGSFTVAKNFVWDSLNNITGKGILLTLTYKVGNDVSLGEHTIDLVVRDCVNSNGEVCKTTVENIVITVVSDDEPSDGDLNGANSGNVNNGNESENESSNSNTQSGADGEINTENGEVGNSCQGSSGCSSSLSISCLIIAICASMIFVFKKKEK